MKKIAIIALVMGILCMAGASAQGRVGLGLYAGGAFSDGNFGPNGGISIKLGAFPVLGIQFAGGDNWGFLGISADYHLVNAAPLGSILTWFFGPGLQFNIGLGDSSAMWNLGLRIPVGLQLWLVRNFELFVDVVPNFSLLSNSGFGIGFGVGAELGFRFYI